MVPGGRLWTTGGGNIDHSTANVSVAWAPSRSASLAEMHLLLMVDVCAEVSRACLRVQVTGRPLGAGGSHRAVCIWTFYTTSGAAGDEQN